MMQISSEPVISNASGHGASLSNYQTKFCQMLSLVVCKAQAASGRSSSSTWTSTRAPDRTPSSWITPTRRCRRAAACECCPAVRIQGFDVIVGPSCHWRSSSSSCTTSSCGHDEWQHAVAQRQHITGFYEKFWRHIAPGNGHIVRRWCRPCSAASAHRQDGPWRMVSVRRR